MVLAQHLAKYAVAGILYLASMSIGLDATGMPASDSESFSGIETILSVHCVECHGRNVRKGGLRLDDPPALAQGGDSGPLFVPGESGKSLLVRKITASDPADRMPPKGSPLSVEDIARVVAWIDAGAPVRKSEKMQEPEVPDHWSFHRPSMPDVPTLNESAKLSNPIDAFVLKRLAEEGLFFSPEADRTTLIRRLSLDLTGLPPTPDEVDAFLSDPRPDAYDRLVDRLLASPHYGERQALHWLDIARYADTNGFEKDRARSIWPYRDWVIRAFNQDLPFDRFVIEQLAGDMLPNATLDQRIATGFHRNTMVNEEGGIDVEEFRYEALVDRANTTATAFLGLTLACAQCHTHKYDPITQREYFQFLAFFDSSDDVIIEVPSLEVEKERRQREARIEAMTAELSNQFPLDDAVDSEDGLTEGERRRLSLERHFQAWQASIRSKAVPWQVARVVEARSKGHATFVQLPDGSVLVKGDWPNTDTYELSLRVDRPRLTAIRLEVLPDRSLPGGGPGRGVIMEEGDFLLSELSAAAAPWYAPHELTPLSIVHASEDYAAEGRSAQQALDGKLDTGWSVKGATGRAHAAVFRVDGSSWPGGETLLKLKLDQVYVHQHTIGRFRVSVTDAEGEVTASGVPAHIETVLLLEPAERTASQREELLSHYLNVAPELVTAREPIDALRATMPKHPTTLVMEEREEPRVTRIRHRGEFLEPREAVTPDVPAILPPLPETAPRTRLTLARWLVASENPLTARVTVNRMWQQYFGRGLVNTPEDFGLRGEPPTHPELLDWLAVEFMRRGWSVKDLTRLLVTSATYRQSSRVTHELYALDPSNELLGRSNRFRVEAEIIRDILLFTSGLLRARIGGPSVHPPVPQGLLALVYDTNWTASEGDDLHRRGLYTYWKRTLPYPAASVFDAPARDTVCVRRIRSNTPLQALTMLNDPLTMEAAQALAIRVLREAPKDTASRVKHLYKLTLSRWPDEHELAWVTEFLGRRFSGFTEAGADPEQAVWTLVARAMLNLDETITRP